MADCSGDEEGAQGGSISGEEPETVREADMDAEFDIATETVADEVKMPDKIPM